MNPIEARLFIMEARLRSEENNRIHIYEELHEIAEGLKHLKLNRKEKVRPGPPNSLEALKPVDIRRVKQDQKKNFATLYDQSNSPSPITSERVIDLDSTSPISLTVMPLKYEKPKMNQRYNFTSPNKPKLPIVKTASPGKRSLANIPFSLPNTSYTPVRYKVMDFDEEQLILGKRAV